ncbi:hypothetical protein D9M71_792420 [compost metagenome]
MGGKKPRQRQVDLPDLAEVHRVVQRAQPLHFVRRQRQRRIRAKARPFFGRKQVIGRIVPLLEIVLEIGGFDVLRS